MQKGFSLIFILIGVLILGGIGGYYFYQQQVKQINSFEECSKKYPVLTSYPGQCNTPDGRHFVQQLTDEEKKKLVPPTEVSPAGGSLDEEGWRIYTGETTYTTDGSSKFSIKYPASWTLKGDILYPLGFTGSGFDAQIGLGMGGHEGPDVEGGEKNFPAGTAYYVWDTPKGAENIYALASFSTDKMSYIFEGLNLPENSNVINEEIFIKMISTLKILK